MQTIHVAASILNQTPLDWSRNLANVKNTIREARSKGITLLCLPELCLSGYGCEDAFHSADMLKRSWSSLMALLPETSGLIVCVGLPVLHQNALFNCAALLVDGHLAGLVAKQHLAGDGIHYEPRWFKEWPQGVIDQHHPQDGAAAPIGDIHFDVGGIRIGFEICEDAWVANRPGAALAGRGVDLILNPSASHFAFGKLEVRKRFVLEGSRAFGVSYIYSNLVGNEAGRAIYDGGALIATGGRLIAGGPRFSFADFVLTEAWIDVNATRMGQARSASFQPSIKGPNPACIHAPFEWPDKMLPTAHRQATLENPHAWESSRTIKEEEFTRAVGLGLFDYLRKSHSNGFVVSLSGGADSAAVICLIHLALGAALKELGAAGVRAKLAHLKALPETSDPRVLTKALLTTAYQATEHSGAVTRTAAAKIAVALGAEHMELDVSLMHRGYLEAIEQAIGRRLNWEKDDITLQNIQARVRSPGIWMIANLRNALLLSTSNRSEAAVGYATMDGDTSGGLSPIAGIDKHFLRQWLRWVEQEGPEGIGPIGELSVINSQQPTAELRPASAGQTDEDDLMPYDVLDAVEKLAIRDKRSPIEVWRHLQPAFPQFDSVTLGAWTERFFKLWSRNQWKRERYAPSFHLDDENLDPKTWCRWPILSGGFETELAELRATLANQPISANP